MPASMGANEQASAYPHAYLSTGVRQGAGGNEVVDASQAQAPRIAAGHRATGIGSEDRTAAPGAGRVGERAATALLIGVYSQRNRHTPGGVHVHQRVSSAAICD